MNGLLNWLKGFTQKPDRVIVVHGEDTVTDPEATVPYWTGNIILPTVNSPAG